MLERQGLRTQMLEGRAETSRFSELSCSSHEPQEGVIDPTQAFSLLSTSLNLGRQLSKKQSCG